MKSSNAWSLPRTMVAVSLLAASLLCCTGREINVVQTNTVDRWITNTIEVRVPANRFVTQYITNLVERTHTNFVPLYVTNLLTVRQTNRFTMNKYVTNFVTELHTNVLTMYRTNWKGLHLTNWETVLVFRTNWVRQPVTNLVDIDLSDRRAARAEPAVAAPLASPEPVRAGGPVAAGGSGGFIFEAARTAKAPVNDQVEVRVRLKGVGPGPAQLVIQQWKIESEDGRFLVFGQDQEFKRDLPTGRYKVEVKGRKNSQSPLITVRGSLVVTAGEASIQSKPLASM